MRSTIVTIKMAFCSFAFMMLFFQANLDANERYEYDPVIVAGNQAPERYEYDPAGRLIRVTYDDSTPIRYTYDNNGNILSVIVAVCGDVHPAGGGDGDDDILDALRKLKIAVGLVIPDEREMIVGDVHPDNDSGPDGDGDIDVLDALRDLKAAVGLVEITSCGGPT